MQDVARQALDFFPHRRPVLPAEEDIEHDHVRLERRVGAQVGQPIAFLGMLPLQEPALGADRSRVRRFQVVGSSSPWMTGSADGKDPVPMAGLFEELLAGKPRNEPGGIALQEIAVHIGNDFRNDFSTIGLAYAHLYVLGDADGFAPSSSLAADGGGSFVHRSALERPSASINDFHIFLRLAVESSTAVGS